MIKNNNRNSRDDKSKAGGSNTGRRPAGTDKPKARFNDKDGKNNSGFDKKEDRDKDKRKSGFAAGDKKEYKPRTARDGDSKPYSSSRPSAGKDFKPRSDRDGSAKEYKPRAARDGDSKPYSSRPSAGKDFKPRTENNEKGGFKPWEKKESGNSGYKPKAYKEGSSRDDSSETKRSYIKKDNYAKDGEKPNFADRKGGTSRSTDSRPYRKREDGDFKRKDDRGERVAPATRARKNAAEPKDDGLIRLNRYIANSGICSRRKADELIEAGVISVNGVPISELGHKIDPYKDEVRYNGELLKREKKVYVLLNKPKDYITTTDDPQERRTVMQLVEKASRERIYPVGRLDRNTTGLILMTNDGELADKLSHPRNGITKIYHVELSKNLSQGDFNKIQFGLELEDGVIKPDNISYVAGASKKEIGIQIHSGKNRIVRRIFEHLGYDVVKLDRVVYGNLTKKDLPRGRWRFLEEHELIQIKHLIK
ncbi:pseudouridine synthase [Pedobacter sp. Hv1]|uniref:pseudouridine synthase n=1 Tax=Pedobacter sp. Hv1 TaxID=1740090 RepID=UPI0006D8B24B|nr:pseudouridine synthase [Pedobacter sp. Hv1]KQB99745.1 pseudouridylate synthase [Pedobacter sp. Hv1]